MLKNILYILLFILSSCDLIDYHPYDARINTDTDINQNNISRILQTCANKDTLRFVMMGDTQRWYDETEEFVQHINKRNDIDFIIHGGDISDFGLKKEYILMHEILSGLNIPYVVLLGNHDVLGNGIRVYQHMYGNENFTFTVCDTKFVCLNTNAIEFDYSLPIPDFRFIKECINDTTNYKRSVVVMHAPPKSEQFNNNVDEVFQLYIRQFQNLLFCLHAHNHSVSQTDIFDDGVIYYGCSNIKKKSYLLFTLTPDNQYTYEVIYF